VITVTSTWLVHKIFTYMDITQLKLIKLTCKDIHGNGNLCVSIAVVKVITLNIQSKIKFIHKFSIALFLDLEK